MLFPLTHDDPYELGSYRLTARLGSGGMGTVYLGRSPGGRGIALKTMHARIAADPQLRSRFRLETDAARVIGGRYGAEVVAADPFAETPWLATEYVLGPPLDEAVDRSGPLPETSVRALGAALCGALGQLHLSEVVHRDLKPSNIIVTAYGPKVIDFGIARAIGDDRLTRTGAAVGTPAFMSPEQATDQEHTPAGDVFALAAVLVFAATGRGPFGDGRPADLLYRVRFTEPDLSAVPAALAPVLAHALAKDPSQRPTTAALGAQLHDGSGEFADHLPDLVLDEIGRRATEVWQFTPARLPAPAQEPPPPPAAPPEPTGLSRRRLLIVGGGSVAGLAAAGVGSWALSKGDDPAAPFRKPTPGPSVRPLPKKKLDSLWQKQVAGPPDDLIPAAPIAARDLAMLVAGTGLAAFNATSGGVAWVSDKGERTWQLAPDGDELYQLLEPKGAEGHKGDPWPLQLASVDLTSGRAHKPLAEFSDLNGVMYENQLLCVSDGVLYVVAGKGEYSMDGFLPSQSWSVFAIDADTGKRRWSKPLPSRPDGSDRLHFLSATVVGNRLVALQETNGGKVRVIARDTRTGDVIWDKPLAVAKPDSVRLPLTVDRDHVYLGCGQLRALRLSDGGQAWSSGSARPGRTYGPPSVKDGVLYAVEKGTGLVAADARSGKPKWVERGGNGVDAAVTDRPVVGSDHVYRKGAGTLAAIDLSSRTPARLYKTSGDRFIAQERSNVVIALGGHFFAAFPLQ
ncbi:hypothetical protein VT50_0218860 [Streptomyces antioxidans]|uniref:Protein kinase domain-containing protein n=1 Tax=Streptomyces antioxidans TaxID=1507734 RepID=A0A1V4D338_9ACTN|nr:serine/threonine-protein kinase [Streptomyces antioxidans]OPF78480.1 hypothetical protein VT50_0218860 [Streptomyces antioxidans]